MSIKLINILKQANVITQKGAMTKNLQKTK